MEAHFMEITLPSLFDWDQCLVYLKRSEQEILHRIQENKVYKALKIKDKLILFVIHEKNARLHVKWLKSNENDEVISKTVSFIREWFDLDQDLSPFYAFAREDSILKDLVKQYKGYRLIGVPDLFEAIVWAILGQQIHLNFAYTLKKRFVKNFGEKLMWDKRTFWVFPEPKTIAKLQVKDLRKLQLTERKAEYVINVAQLMAKNELSKHVLSKMSFSELEKTLTNIRGIGPWTANYVMMRCFKRMESLPMADVGLQRALGKQLGLKRKVTEKEIKKIAENWQGWEAYATFYLWRSFYSHKK